MKKGRKLGLAETCRTNQCGKREQFLHFGKDQIYGYYSFGFYFSYHCKAFQIIKDDNRLEEVSFKGLKHSEPNLYSYIEDDEKRKEQAQSLYQLTTSMHNGQVIKGL